MSPRPELHAALGSHQRSCGCWETTSMAPPVAPVLLEKVEESISTCTEHCLQQVSDNLTAFSCGSLAYIDTCKSWV